MAPFEIKIPTSLGDKTLVDFFKGWNWRTDLRGEVVLDLEQTEFLAPWALTMFSLYGLFLSEERGNLVRVKLDPNTEAGRYAIRLGLLELFGTPRPQELAGHDARAVRMTRIRSNRDVPEFAFSVLELLQIEDDELAAAVKYSVVELLRNVVQHAGSPTGGLSMAQYYPNSGLVEVVVADLGVGVRQTLSARYPDLPDDLAALRFALLPHVSGTFANSAYSSMRDNAGLGLFFIKEITTRGNGGFFFGSGLALVDLWGRADGSPGKLYKRAYGTGWPGTFAYLQLRRDKIADFDSLLSVCRTLAAEARQDPSELRLDFLDEIPDIPGLHVVRVSEFEEDVEAAAARREEEIIPKIQAGELVVLDFSGIRSATQSFAHACIYRILRDVRQSTYALSIAGCTPATQEAIRAVAAYAKTGESPHGL